MPVTNPDDAAMVLEAVVAYRSGQPLLAETLLAQLEDRAVPSLLEVLAAMVSTIETLQTP